MSYAVRGVAVAIGLAWSTALAAEPNDESFAFGPGRVVLVPINLAVRTAAELEPGLTPVWRELMQYFASEESPVIALERAGAVELWNEVMADAAEEVGRGDLYAAYARFAQQVAGQVPFGSIVFPTLVTRAARVSGRVAIWDGVRRPVEVPGIFSEAIDTLRDGKIWVTRSGAQGELAAASLHVAVLSAGGELRFERTSALVLLQQLVEPKDEKRDLELTTVTREDAFADPQPLRDGIAAAFGGGAGAHRAAGQR